MLRDLRIRNSNRPTKIPFGYQAYIYCWYGPDDVQYRVIIASDKLHADQLLRDWCFENGLETSFWRSVDVVDWMLAANGYDEHEVLL